MKNTKKDKEPLPNVIVCIQACRPVDDDDGDLSMDAYTAQEKGRMLNCEQIEVPDGGFIEIPEGCEGDLRFGIAEPTCYALRKNHEFGDMERVYVLEAGLYRRRGDRFVRVKVILDEE